MTFLGLPLRREKLPPLSAHYDVELEFKGLLIEDADHFGVLLKTGERIAPKLVLITERSSETGPHGRVFDYARMTLRNVQYGVTWNDAGVVELLKFTDGTLVKAEWLSGVVFRKPVDA